jgi:hypothetical protein
VLQVLFGIPTQQIAPRLAALPAALGITPDEALLLAQDCPHFVLLRADTAAAGWWELRRAASKRAEWREQIGNWTAESVCRCAPQSMTLAACWCGSVPLKCWHCSERNSLEAGLPSCPLWL